MVDFLLRLIILRNVLFFRLGFNGLWHDCIFIYSPGWHGQTFASLLASLGKLWVANSVLRDRPVRSVLHRGGRQDVVLLEGGHGAHGGVGEDGEEGEDEAEVDLPRGQHVLRLLAELDVDEEEGHR